MSSIEKEKRLDELNRSLYVGGRTANDAGGGAMWGGVET